MAKMKRLNRVVNVKDEDVKEYLSRGYDQIDDEGKVEKKATGGRNVSIEEYNALLTKMEDVEKANRELAANNTDAERVGELEARVRELEAEVGQYEKENTQLNDELKKLRKNR